MTIAEAEKQIVEEFSLFEDWMDKYNYIIELGQTLPPIDPQYKTDTYLISGCQSQVWLHAAYQNGKVVFTADSDAIITKGIVHLLVRVLTNQSPDDILTAKMEYIEELGLREHLSPTRSNGLLSMIKQMKLYALVFKNKEQA
jgi:cysteine desulfuration protein SufE